MNLIIGPDGMARWGVKDYRCALGRGGRSAQKQEGDGATPIGAFLCRQVLWRQDRLPSLVTGLPQIALTPESGWCDDPQDPAYNRSVILPYPGRTEALWRDGAVYDVIVALGYNDDPVIPGQGSAIFLHVAREHFTTTEGCVALSLSDLLEFLRQADRQTRIVVTG